EVHTPNAVAAVRGTVFVVEVTRQGAQNAGGALSAHTQVTTVHGTVEVGPLGRPGTTTFLTQSQSLGLLGSTVGQPRTLNAHEIGRLLAAYTAALPATNVQSRDSFVRQERNKAMALAAQLVPDPTETATTIQSCTLGCLPPIIPPIGLRSDQSTLKGEKLSNGGFESGSFPPGWSLGGGGQVITSLGAFTAPAGQFMGFISSGPGSLPGSLDPSGRFTQFSALSQSFQATGGTLYTIKATYNFVSNEYPYWTTLYAGNSPFNDTFDVKIKTPGGPATQVATLSINSAFTPNQVSQQQVSVAGFSAGGGCATCGWGYTGFKTLTFSWLAPTSGEAALIFEVGDVGDTVYSSGVMIDEVSVLQDPPLYLVQGGTTLTHPSSDPLLDYHGGSATFDSAMVVAGGSKASLGGPLLRATDTNLTAPVSLLSVLPGGSFASTTTGPLVSLTGGNHAIGTDIAIFDIAGSGTTVDLRTGQVVATDTPLTTGGGLLAAAGATITTQQVLRVDAALLEASAPVAALLRGSQLTSASDAIALSGQSRLTSRGTTLVALDASRLIVSRGALVNVTGGSGLTVTGNLLTLSNGSTLSVLNGPLLSVSGGSFASIGGALAAFGGAGGNLLSVSNNLCGGSCALFGGIPVALLNGATAANVSIADGAVKNSSLGAIKYATATTALLSVSGAGSKVTVGGK
ncbi:MAG TPA: choice-of-anchor L domain-containing protein, partial [Candidatus Dormibacteraeota bacterium]|nr:choice-of-anchor L domain-containing protein [Candidatus Dormibacteraeota bacterium]